MPSSAPTAKIHLHDAFTRIHSDLEIAVSDSSVVTVDPDDASVTVGQETSTGEIRVRNAGGNEAGRLFESVAGNVRVNDTNGSNVVSLYGATDSTLGLMIGVTTSQDENLLEVNNYSEGGAIDVHTYAEDDSVTNAELGAVTAKAESDGGEVILRTVDDETTGELLGGEGALLLSGLPEDTPSGSGNRREHGGGEVVLSEYAPPGETPDVRIHVRGEKDSDYGVDDSNRPRINVDGPTATLDVGRNKVGSDRQAIDGSIVLRDDVGTRLLEANAKSPLAEPGGEIVFAWKDTTHRDLRGIVRAHPDGLMIYDAGGNPAMLIGNSGAIETRKPIQTDVGSLP